MAILKPKLQPNGTTLITGEVRLSYCHLLEPASINGSDPKYSVAVLVRKDDKETLRLIKEGVDNAVQAGKTKNGEKFLAGKLKKPLRDGDDPEENKGDEFKGCYFFNCNSNSKPTLVDQRMQPVTDPDVIYSGCYARVSVNFYPFDQKGSKGVAAGLNNVQKVRDGERLGGGKTDAFEEFEAIEESYAEGGDDIDPMS